MRGIFLFLVILICVSCGSSKVEFNPIDCYLDSVINKGKINIIDKKISNNRTILILNGFFLFDTKSNSNERLGSQSALYNSSDFKKLVNKYSNDTITLFWKRKDFRRNNTVLINSYKFFSNELYKDYVGNEELPVYAFSNPINYSNDSICLFTVIKSNTTFSPPISEFVIIMKKEKNKWKIIDKVWADENYVN